MTFYRIKHFINRIWQWEFWPQWLLYMPVFPVYLYYACKARTPFFVVATNPGIENGGYLLESKYDIHLRLPAAYTPKTAKINPDITDTELEAIYKGQGFRIPFYCKPDVGGKGLGVRKISSMEELLDYHRRAPHAYLLQEEIPYKNEIGVFYCKLPGADKGIITGIVGKEFMMLRGDGTSTVKQLIQVNTRYYLQRHTLFRAYQSMLSYIPHKGEKIMLSAIGNHARGCLFTDITSLNQPSLHSLIDNISADFNGFYFGRYDIKYNEWEELCSGEHFMIVELNGGGSEPTHLYDPGKSIWNAWKIILLHWRWMYNIANTHHKQGVPYLGLRKGIALNRKARRLSRLWKESGL